MLVSGDPGENYMGIYGYYFYNVLLALKLFQNEKVKIYICKYNLIL